MTGRAEVADTIARIDAALAGLDTVRIMEVCGTHTVSLLRSGVKSLLPEKVKLISGPGCPVCVTSQSYIDAALEIASAEGVTIATYGDMVRVPGRTGSLETMRGEGAQVEVVYSTRDALKLAEKDPGRRVVFLAIGFETTAPATAAALVEAEARGIENFFALCAHKLVVPAMMALLSAGDVPIDGFLCPGHVSVIIGADAYKPVAEEFGKPCVVAGFEPREMAAAILRIVEQAAAGKAGVENAYGTAVKGAGNEAALALLDKVFVPGDAVWRAIGTIPQSGLVLAGEFGRFDAAKHFDIEFGPDYEPEGCRCGDVIQGKAEAADCPLFGGVCTPSEPVGPCMVSSEGSCAAAYKYGNGKRGR